MTVARRKKIVVLGMMSKMPVPGNIWLVAQYLIGFQRLGFDVYYVEAHGITPTKVMKEEDDDGALLASKFIAGVMTRFDLPDRWAYHSVFEDRYFGMSAEQLGALYQSADLIINLHGGTVPLPEHSATGRLIYLETDPVQLQIELHAKDEAAVKFLEPHVAFFSWGLNYGHPDCQVPLDSRFPFRPTLPPVLMDFWESRSSEEGSLFTTVGNWRQTGTVTYQGETYYWSKDREFRKFLDLPARVGPQFELALSRSSRTDADVSLLTSTGWRVRDPLALSSDLDEYRRYICESRGEFTVAKDQNVRLRSGWFSERSATYLASGRPVVTQDTGFGSVLPTGEGLFAFSTVTEAADAINEINADYQRHRRAATGIARDCFSHDVVLKRLLDDLGLTVSSASGQQSREALPLDLVIVPTSRWPTTLPPATVDFMLASPVPAASNRPDEAPIGRTASIVIVSLDNLVFTKLCLASVLANTEHPDYEVIVVDNGSTDGTPEYLRALASRHRNVRVVFNDDNRGFAPANNQGLGIATGEVLVLLNNDTIVPRGWLGRLTNHLGDPAIGLVGPVTNRAGNEAEIEAPYRTYGELLDFVRARTNEQNGKVFDIRVATMFCVAMRRAVWERLGPLDEQFEVGLFEDDDYAMRAREAGYRIVCAEDTFVHHFGQASIGKLGPTRGYGTLFHQNRRRWEEKWGKPWQPYSHRRTERYQDMIDRIHTVVRETLPPDETVLVVSRGDDALLALEGRTAWHFPRTEDGVYSGCHPKDGAAAIRDLEAQRDKGARFLVVPSTAVWWLDHYTEFRQHLERLYTLQVNEDDACVIFDLRLGQQSRVNGAASASQEGTVARSPGVVAAPAGMTVTPLDLAGLLLIEVPIWRDDRGFFMERFQLAGFHARGLPTAFVQDNHSRSLPGVLRGLHYQDGPPQGKLVGVTRGRIWDVAVDIRPDSRTFGRSVGIELSDANGRLLWIPGGFAHGFCVLGNEPADLLYKVDTPYNPAREGGIFWDDQELAIRWPVDRPIVSPRDEALPGFSALRAAFMGAGR